MKNPTSGSIAWFEAARRRCVDHLRALLAIRMAQEYVQRLLLGLKAGANVSAATALHTACVIAYCRPFTTAKTRSGQIQYKTRLLRKATGFDRQLHDHLLDLRNRLIAHGDYDLLPSSMYFMLIGDERLPVSIGINVKILAGLDSISLAERYVAHFSACLVSIEQTLNEELRHLAEQALKHPGEFNATHNIPEVVHQTAVEKETSVTLSPTGPASNVAEPVFPRGLAGYSYLLLRHELALLENGIYIVHQDGKPVEMKVSVT